MKPLSNKVIVVTRTVHQGNDNVVKLKELGADVIHFPSIAIEYTEHIPQFDEALKEIDKYDYIIFSSTNAVSVFLDRISKLEQVFPYEEIVVVVVGRKTAEFCKEAGVKVDLIPDDFSAEGLLEIFANRAIYNSRILLPSSKKARETLRYGLQNMGAAVDYIPVYDAVIPPPEILVEPLSELRQKNPDTFIFTSPSTFTNFLAINLIGDPRTYFRDKTIAVIGPVTGWAVDDAGLEVDIQPEVYTFDALIEKLIEYFADTTIKK